MNSLFSSRSHRGRQRLTRTAAGRRSAGRLRATLERLEERRLLTVSPSDYDSVSAEWFTMINEPLLPQAADTGGSATDWFGADSVTEDSPGAGSGASWIVRLSPQVLETVSRVADAVGLFAAAPGLRVLGGLGLPGQLLLEASAAADAVLSMLASQGIVSAYEPNLPISVSALTASSTPDDPRYGDLYGLHNTGQSGGTADADIDAPEAWQVSTGSRDVIVGVVDTGIDYTHPDLAANIWVNPGEIAGNGIDDDGNGFVDDVHGYDFVNNDGDPFDDNGHGTHCAGTIGGVGNNGTGVVGVNWDVSLMGLKFLSADGSGSTSDAIQAINYATMMRTQYGHNIRVTSNSWGGGGSSNAMRQAIEAGAAADILFVAAAGNDGSDNDANPQYPASYLSEAVVSVAATNRNDALASFSNYGATSVDLAAPGAGIVSTVPGGGYASYSGTSMATPHVAGAAALALAVDPSLSVADLKTALLSTVDGVSGLTGKLLTGGRLNAGTLLASLSSEPAPPAAPATLSASDGTNLGGIQVAWSSSLFADSYTLYRGESADPTTATVLADGLTGTTYLDSAAAIDSVYHYWVTATNDLGTSPLSASDSGFHAASRSPNDAFADRFVLEGVAPTATGTNVDATAEPGEPVHHGVGGGKSVWWTWTAPAAGTVVIETAGSDFDTVLAVYDGSEVANLTRLVSNDDIDYGVVLQSRVTFPTVAGKTYQIAVDGWGGEVGSISLGVSLDAPEPPAPITGIDLSGSSVAENLPAGTEVGSLTAAGGSGGVAFALVAGEGDADNGLFTIAGGQLRTAAVFDFEAQPTRTIRVGATDEAGQTVEQVFQIAVTDVAEGLLVEQFTAGRDGVTVGFDGPLDLTNLDLHNRAAATADLDVTLVDAAGGLVEAALAVDAAGDGFRLVVNNGLLAAGDYTLTIRSGEAGVVAADGRLLDGDGDGVGGDDFVTSFTVEPLPAGTAVVGVPGFFEDAGQEVNLPAVASGGIPVIVTAPEGVMSLDMELFYNPGLLEVTGVELAAGLPDGALTLINVVAPGHAVVGFFSPQPLAAGSYAVARLLATVPTSATTDQTHVLDVSNVSLNEGLIPAVDDDGIHVVAVGNRAPTGISLTGGGVPENSPAGTLAGTLAAVDPDYGDAFSFALVAGAGDADNAAFAIDGTSLLTTASFDYEAGATRTVRVRVTDAEGESFERPLLIEVLNEIESLHVTGLTPTVDGFRVSFSEPIDPVGLNLYDAMDVLGAADLSLVGEQAGAVRGSLVVAADGRGLQFVASSPLAADSYTVTLQSGDTAFRAVTGGLLDGDADETVGDDYIAGFTNILPPVLLGVPSFARGAGQAVNLPADSAAGIPVQLTSDGTVSVLTATLRYDPALLTVSAVSPAADLPAGTLLKTELLEPGLISLRLEGETPLPAGSLTIGSLQADVAATATPGAAGLISFAEVDTDAGVAAGRTAVQLVASLGDTSGDGSYSNADSTLAARLAMRIDTGLVAYATIDPLLVADVSGNGSISMLDAAMIAGVAGGQQGPAAPTVTPPTQMLLRHDGVYRAANVPDLSGVLSADDSQLLASSRDSAASRARAFADLAAGWAAAGGTTASIDSTVLFAAADGDGGDADGLFADPGLNPA